MTATLTPDAFTANVNAGLDRLEAALPAVPARVLRLQRTVAEAYCDRTSAFWSDLADTVRSIFGAASVSGKTVLGQARAAVEDVATRTRNGAATVAGQTRRAAADVAETAQTGAATVAGQARAATLDVAASARRGANTVTGQAAAQGRKLADTAESTTSRTLDRAIDAVDDQPGSGTPYEQWTRAQLIERAKAAGIRNRTRLSKAELISALRAG
ncbi:MAG TPA: hypothetical protein VK360_00950 [Acidimicrobiales bacterium]|nr:hypothetical protein [Acidimicrobiales bacterium]